MYGNRSTINELIRSILFEIAVSAHWRLEDQISGFGVFASLSPSHGSIEFERRQGGITGHRELYASNTGGAHEINDERQKLSRDALTSITVIDRESDYLSGGEICGAMSDHARVIYTFVASNAQKVAGNGPFAMHTTP
jgi:hypothetical protein